MLPHLISNFNSSYHSGIKKAPNDVDDEEEDVIKVTNGKYNKAKNEETKYMIGDHVRYIINRKQFKKGTLAKWSKTVHKIASKTEHTYKLENGNYYKYYELQKVDDVQMIEKPPTGLSRERMKKDRRSERRINKEGSDKSMILEK